MESRLFKTMTFCPVGVTAATPSTTLEFTFANVSPTTTESGTINLLNIKSDDQENETLTKYDPVHKTWAVFQIHLKRF